MGLIVKMTTIETKNDKNDLFLVQSSKHDKKQLLVMTKQI
jgi:hypothetical protein